MKISAVVFLLIASQLTGSSVSEDIQNRPAVKSDPPFVCEENGFFPVGACSSQYYICLDGSLYPGTCPPGGVFDPAISACVAIENLPSCQTTVSSSTVTVPNSGSSTLKPIECSTDGSFEFSKCQSSYYICASGIPYYQTCPNGHVFVEAESLCKPLEETDCLGNESTTTTLVVTTETTTTTAGPFECPNNETGFYPISPEACSKNYYTCLDGIAYPMECPGENVFDATQQICTAPENAAACILSSKIIEN